MIYGAGFDTLERDLSCNAVLFHSKYVPKIVPTFGLPRASEYLARAVETRLRCFFPFIFDYILDVIEFSHGKSYAAEAQMNSCGDEDLSGVSTSHQLRTIFNVQ